MVSLHFSLENVAFHTESREIAKGCTETHCMKKEDEQFGHSTSLVFYLPMVSSIFIGSCSEYEGQEGMRAFFGRILVYITNMGTPGPSLHTVYWLCDTLKKREVYTSKYCVGDEYSVLLHACGWYVHIQPTNTFTQHNYMMCTAVSFLKWIADY